MYMRQLTHTFKNVTLTFKFNKESKYYLDGDNVIQLDLDWMQKQCYLLWNSLSDKRSKIVRDYDNVLVSLTEAQFNSIKKADDAWVDRKLREMNVKPTGSEVILNKLIGLKGSK